MRPARGSFRLDRVREPGGSTSIDRLRLCTRSSIPFFSRLVMCLCTVARLFSPCRAQSLQKKANSRCGSQTFQKVDEPLFVFE
jgi:hypothetical protein